MVDAAGRRAGRLETPRDILALPTNGTGRNPVMQGQILSPPVVIVTMRRA